MKKRDTDETAVVLDAEAPVIVEEDTAEKKQPRQSLIKKVDGWVNTAKSIGDTVGEIYSDWIKPVRDNWTQIKRRMSMVTTVISIVFFILYVPFLLFSKLSKDLALGWDVALYVCIGVYIVTVISLLIVTLASGNSTSTAMEKKRKKISKVILFVVRVVSLGIGIAALIISAMEGSSDSQTAVIDTIAIIFAVMSIIFSAFPLVFGGIGGFIKWLISPARIKFKFSFVALEWYHSFTSEQVLDKNMKKLAKKYGERVGGCLDKYFLPVIGRTNIKSVDEDDILKLLEAVPDEDLNICEWMTKCIFDYAQECGYVDADANPCDNLELYGDISKESRVKKQSASTENKPNFMNKLLTVFNRKAK